jgi:preprotein translocase SecF subunit
MLNFKGVDFFPHDTRIDFMRWKNVCVGASIVMMVLSLALFLFKGLNYGVDFKGGTLIEIQSKSGAFDIPAMRQKLSVLGLGDVQIQAADDGKEALIRLEQQPGGEKAQQEAVSKINQALGDGVTYRRTEVVGPAVSSELRRTGIIAVLSSLLAIIAYVWFRFDWQYAAGGIVALSHDVLLTVGLFSLLNLEFDLSIVAALLTILGYSINDTVVVSDRIRENLRKFKRMPLDAVLNLSINETLSRTILTGGTTIAVLIALFVFGGPVIRNFNFAMLWGVIVGTYSSIFIAAPLLGYLGLQREGAGKVQDAPGKQTAGA